jgi:hypothetical protein
MSNKVTDNENNSSGAESTKIIDIVAQEAEQVVAKACEAARQEAEQELEKALREYEQRTRQIVLKTREEAKSKTAEIASRLGEAIMMRIEQSSTEAVADAVAGFSKRAEQLTQTLQEAADKEAEQALTDVKAEVKSDTGSGDDDAQEAIAEEETISATDEKQEQQEAEEETDKAKSGFEIEVEQELAGITEDKANGKAQLDSEEFENWLTQ